MTLIEIHDKQIENAAKSVKAFLLSSTKSEEEAHKISDQIDKIENNLKTLDRMTGGQFGKWVNSLEAPIKKT